MKNHQAPKHARKVIRRAVVALSATLIALVAVPAAALADTPERWDTAPHASGLQFLVVLVLIPTGLFLVISLLTVLPSMISDRGYEPGQSWRSEAEWFGGPRKGVEAADDLSAKQVEAAESDRGGTSGQW